MKIQEMKPGILHLTKKMGMDRRDNILDLDPPPAELFAAPQPVRHDEQRGPDSAAKCDLDEPRWAVVSFRQMEAGGLTYRQAAALLNQLDLNDVTGLCIVTDEAAKRIRR
jgi:hypothetical protein